ncbi:MAG: efflux RND transporter periplasmic adaptor subunit [Opitutaceae bacterium]|jgi:multidrug efflux pump subunit AcrA (membrane-fusion protein)
MIRPLFYITVAALFVQPAASVFGHGGQIETGGGGGGPVTLTKVQQASIGLQTAQADFRTIDSLLRLTGTVKLDPDRRAHVTTRISGRVEKLFASVGDTVEKGQKLALIQSRLPGDPPPEIPVEAPFSGTINARDVSLGDAIEPNTELFDIIDLSKVIVVARVYEADIGLVKKGQTARIAALGYPGLQLTGKVTFIGLELDPDNRTLPVWIAVDNPEGKLRVGLFAQANLILSTADGLLTVPKEAILEEGGEKFVFVQTGNTFNRVDVQVGVADDRFVEIKDGLVPGDAVVVLGQRELFTQWLTGGVKAPAKDND